MTHTFGVGEYKTRDGRKAVVLHVLAHAGMWPLLGYVTSINGGEHGCRWRTDGRTDAACFGEHDDDLMPPPPPRVERWQTYRINHHDGRVCLGGHPCRTESTARKLLSAGSTGILKFTIEGEGSDARIVSAEVVDA